MLPLHPYPQSLKQVLRKKAEDIGSELKAFTHFKKEAGDGGLDVEGLEKALERSGVNASQTAVRQLFNSLDPNRFCEGAKGHDTINVVTLFTCTIQPNKCLCR